MLTCIKGFPEIHKRKIVILSIVFLWFKHNAYYWPKYTLHNSLDFINRIQNHPIAPNSVSVSFLCSVTPFDPKFCHFE